jgi:hypothetical protein
LANGCNLSEPKGRTRARDLRVNKIPVKVGWAKTKNKLNRKIQKNILPTKTPDKLIYYFFANPQSLHFCDFLQLPNVTRIYLNELGTVALIL